MGNAIVDVLMGLAILVFAVIFFVGQYRRGHLRERLAGKATRHMRHSRRHS